MTETEAENGKSTPDDKPAAKSAQKSDSGSDSKLQKDLEIALSLPLPAKNAYWHLEPGVASKKGKKGVFRFLKRKEMSEEELSDLRQESENAPGRARVKIQMLNKKYANSSALMMLSALCTYRMIRNSTNRRGVLDGLKSAAKESALAMLSDGISLYNIENYFTIYFEYLAKLKRFQVNTFKTASESMGVQASKDRLAAAMKVCGRLLDEKDRAFSVLSRVKGKFKSSSYILPWLFADIQLAAKKVEDGEYKFACGPAEARETLVYTLALCDLFARIPMIYPLVETILRLIPESNTALFLRKSSVITTHSFTQLEVAAQEGDIERMRTIGMHIYQAAKESLNRINNQPIRQSYEADPYFHLSRLAILTFGAFEPPEQATIMGSSLKAMKKVVKLDMSKNHAYTESASSMVNKLSDLMPD